jgi:hypothetical protein
MGVTYIALHHEHRTLELHLFSLDFDPLWYTRYAVLKLCPL